MRNFLKIPKILAIILVASMALAGTSCKKKKDDPPEPDTPPTLPPIESIRLDFSDFQSNPGDSKGSAKVVEDTYVNYSAAYTGVNFWEVLLEDDLLAVPVAGLSNALARTGQEVSSGTFEWNLSFTAQSVSYVGTLVAVKGASSFTMELNAAPSGSGEVKYFDATVSNDLSSVDWNIYNSSSTKVLDGLYGMDETSGFESLEYTYVLSGQTESGSSIEYNYTPSATFDATFYMIMSTGAVDVEWNTSSKQGRVMSSSVFGDSNWHCWNDVLADVSCSK